MPSADGGRAAGAVGSVRGTADAGGPGSDVGGPGSDVGGPGSDVGGPGSDVGGLRADAGGPRADAGRPGTADAGARPDGRRPAPPPLPGGFGLTLDPGTRLHDDGRLLIGGSPRRIVRLSAAGASVLDALLARGTAARERAAAGSSAPAAGSPASATNASPARELPPVAPGSGSTGTTSSPGEPAPPPSTDAAGRLARRLVDAGVAHPVPPTGAGDVADVTIVIPVRDRPAELARCLAALVAAPRSVPGGGADVAARVGGRPGTLVDDATGDAASVGGRPRALVVDDGADIAAPTGARSRVLVVDDGSADPSAVREAAAAVGADVLRRDVAGGPAAARNAALAVVGTPLVAFLDSDCVPPPGWLGPLVAQLADLAVGAVAPRVRGLAVGTTAAARWGAARSPLDLGVRPARIAPGTPVAYAPTAALVVRRAAVADGFDPALRYGEDVDLVWRLHDAGWALRYEPAVVVGHAEPAAWGPFLARRRHYGTSAGPLARRHGRRLAPVVLAPWPTVAAALVLARRPRAAAAVVAADAVRTQRGLRAPGVPPTLGVRVVARNAVQTLDGLARTGAMLAPAPLLSLAAARPRARLPVLGLLAGAPLVRWVAARRDGRTAGLDPLRWTAASLADDAAYGAGVWAGAIGARAPWAVRPAVAWPTRTTAGSGAAATPGAGRAGTPDGDASS